MSHYSASIHTTTVEILDDGALDAATLARTGRNPGREAAESAAAAVGGRAVFPHGLPEGGSDFNDLHRHAGLSAVRDQVEAAIAAVQASAPPAPPRMRCHWRFIRHPTALPSATATPISKRMNVARPNFTPVAQSWCWSMARMPG